jgi:hypothetical protein
MNEEREQISQDEEREIDIKDPWQVLLWCRSLNVTKSQLEAAVLAVGNNSEEIRHYLMDQHH